MKQTKETILAAGLMEGMVPVPLALLRTYKQMNLSETEVMLLIHLLAYTQVERIDFPTMEEIGARMSVPKEEVAKLLEKLLKEGWFTIEEGQYASTDIRFERYDMRPLYEALAAQILSNGDEDLRTRTPLAQSGRPFAGQAKTFDHTAGAEAAPNDLYSIFEREFARPLTPMELETITGWLEQDGYKEELILAALKEAVFTGKLYFRYIDRILLEWHRNRVSNAEQAKVYSQRFRGMG